MMYYVDSGGPWIEPCDTLQEAMVQAENALGAAREFAAKMGFVPFWGKSVEIRRGKSGLAMVQHGAAVHNLRIMENTKIFRTLSL
jgi:hypothetical protein